MFLSMYVNYCFYTTTKLLEYKYILNSLTHHSGYSTISNKYI